MVVYTQTQKERARQKLIHDGVPEGSISPDMVEAERVHAGSEAPSGGPSEGAREGSRDGRQQSPRENPSEGPD